MNYKNADALQNGGGPKGKRSKHPFLKKRKSKRLRLRSIVIFKK